MFYIFQEQSTNIIVVIESRFNEKHSNIEHIFKNIITKTYDFNYIGSGADFRINEELDVSLYDFESFFDPHDFVDERLVYNKDPVLLFSALFYEIDSELFENILKYFNMSYVMEDFQEKAEEMKYLSFILSDGGKSRSDVDFCGLGKRSQENE